METIRDIHGNMLATIKEESGMTVLRDRTNNKLGYYNPISNETRDVNGNKVGTGNLLQRILR